MCSMFFLSCCNSEMKNNEHSGNDNDTITVESAKMVFVHDKREGMQIKEMKLFEKINSIDFSNDPSALFTLNKKMFLNEYNVFNKNDSVINNYFYSEKGKLFKIQEKIWLYNEFYLNQEIVFDTNDIYSSIINFKKSKCFYFNNLPDTFLQGKKYEISASIVGANSNEIEIYLINRNDNFENIFNKVTQKKFVCHCKAILFPIQIMTGSKFYYLKGAITLVDSTGLPKSVKKLDFIYFNKRIPVK